MTTNAFRKGGYRGLESRGLIPIDGRTQDFESNGQPGRDLSYTVVVVLTSISSLCS
jgi:hypothetical protein